MNKLILTIILIFTSPFLSCSDNGDAIYFDFPRGIWVSMEPIQCLGNPWEQDWLMSHDNENSTYPRDFDRQAQIIHDFFERNGVDVRSIRKGNYQPIVCTGCNCSKGYTLYLQISPADVEIMKDWGFEIVN